MTALETRVQDVNARRVRLRVVSAGEGPPLLLLHDFLMDHRAWEGVAPGLAGDFRVVMPDLPGFGESEKPPPARFDYGIEAFADCVTDLIAALGLGRAHVVGHGMSGAIALALAAERPEVIDRVVLVAPLVYPQARGGLLRVPVLGGLVFKQFYGRALFRGYFRERIFSPGFPLPLARIDAFYERFNSPPARESAYATMNALADTRPTVARLARVKRPTFVVWGRSDALNPPQLGQRLAREVGAERFEIMETGHAPYMELPDPFVATVAAFLRRPSRPLPCAPRPPPPTLRPGRSRACCGARRAARGSGSSGRSSPSRSRAPGSWAMIRTRATSPGARASRACRPGRGRRTGWAPTRSTATSSRAWRTGRG